MEVPPIWVEVFRGDVEMQDCPGVEDEDGETGPNDVEGSSPVWLGDKAPYLS